MPTPRDPDPDRVDHLQRLESYEALWQTMSGPLNVDRGRRVPGIYMLRVTGRVQRRCLLIGLFSMLMPASFPAFAEKRVALLIGNESYTSAIGQLANPHNDVARLEKALNGLGFEVAIERDAGLGALTRAVNSYARRLRDAGPNAVGFFYYSGHGAVDGATTISCPLTCRRPKPTSFGISRCASPRSRAS
jgi:hypothetical protein